EKTHAQALFQRAEAAERARVIDAEPPRGARERSRLADGEHEAQVVPVELRLQGVQVQLSRSPCFPAKLASEYWCGHLCEGIKRMKLYYAPGTCSLAPHIVAKEAGFTFLLVRVDIG